VKHVITAALLLTMADGGRFFTNYVAHPMEGSYKFLPE
jgi:hypothetical protein